MPRPRRGRLARRLRANGLCGPWGHQWPQNGVPGPAIGFLQEVARFFGRWLRGEANGAEGDPAMRLYLMDPVAPATHHEERPGRWLGFAGFPPRPGEAATRRLHLGAGTLEDGPTAAPPLSVLSPLTTGLRGQEWCSYGQGRVAAESATDQREDDAGSLCFDAAPLPAEARVVGEARLTLRLAADRPQAQLAARLCAVAPDGASALVTFALLNLAHRQGHAEPAPLVPGRWETVEVVPKPVGQVVPAGHRLRLALSSTYWPMAWPPPEPATLTVGPAGSFLDLPLLGDEGTLVPVLFAEAEHAEAGPVTVEVPARQERRIETDVPTERTTVTALSDDGRSVFGDTGTAVASWRRKEYAITRGDPGSCSASVTSREEMRRPDWHPRVEASVTATADARAFRVRGSLKAYDGAALFAERHYDETIPRDHM